MTTHRLETEHENVPLVESGEKDVIVEYDYDRDVAIGDKLVLFDAETGQEVAQMAVDMVEQMPVRSVPGYLATYKRNYTHDNLADLLRVLNQRHEANITNETQVLAIGYSELAMGNSDPTVIREERGGLR